MDFKKISGLISQATWDEPTLLFHSPEEVEKDLTEGRAVALQEGEELVGFCGWKDFGGWLELSTVYVVPKFRGRGDFLKLLGLACKQLESPTQFKHALLFTQVPAIKRVVVRYYGFRPGKYSELPARVWLSLIIHRLDPRRILSYVKYLKVLHRVGAWQLFVFHRD